MCLKIFKQQNFEASIFQYFWLMLPFLGLQHQRICNWKLLGKIISFLLRLKKKWCYSPSWHLHTNCCTNVFCLKIFQQQDFAASIFLVTVGLYCIFGAPALTNMLWKTYGQSDIFVVEIQLIGLYQNSNDCHSSSLSMKLWDNNVLDMDLLWISLSNWSRIIIWLISPAASMIYPSIPLFTLPSITKKFSAHHLLALHLWVWHDTCNWCFQDS